jgi:hypothetical protein
MRIATGLIAFTLALSSSMALAQSVRWTTYSIPQTGTSVDIPSSIFTELLDKPDGYGERLRSSDGRADLTELRRLSPYFQLWGERLFAIRHQPGI